MSEIKGSTSEGRNPSLCIFYGGVQISERSRQPVRAFLFGCVQIRCADYLFFMFSSSELEEVIRYPRTLSSLNADKHLISESMPWVLVPLLMYLKPYLLPPARDLSMHIVVCLVVLINVIRLGCYAEALICPRPVTFGLDLSWLVLQFTEINSIWVFSWREAYYLPRPKFNGHARWFDLFTWLHSGQNSIFQIFSNE